jgi:nitrite reductase (NADH) small subunit
MKWFELGGLETIPKQGSRVVKTAAGDLAVFRNSDDEVFALNDCCYHQGGPLSQGVVFGKKVACPLHNRVTELDSGNAAPPDTGCTRRYETRVVDGSIFIEIPEPSETAEPVAAVS